MDSKKIPSILQLHQEFSSVFSFFLLRILAVGSGQHKRLLLHAYTHCKISFIMMFTEDDLELLKTPNYGYFIFHQDQKEFLSSAQSIPVKSEIYMFTLPNINKVLECVDAYASVVIHYIGHGMNLGALPGAIPQGSKGPLKFELLYSRFREKLGDRKPLKLILDCCNTGNDNNLRHSSCAAQGGFDFLFEDPRDFTICSSKLGKFSYYVISGWTLFTYALNRVINNSDHLEDFLLRLDHALTDTYLQYHLLESFNKIIYAVDMKKNEEICFYQETKKYSKSTIEGIRVKEMAGKDLDAKINALTKKIQDPKRTPEEKRKYAKKLASFLEVQQISKSSETKIIEEAVTLGD